MIKPLSVDDNALSIENILYNRLTIITIINELLKPFDFLASCRHSIPEHPARTTMLLTNAELSKNSEIGLSIDSYPEIGDSSFRCAL